MRNEEGGAISSLTVAMVKIIPKLGKEARIRYRLNWGKNNVTRGSFRKVKRMENIFPHRGGEEVGDANRRGARQFPSFLS